MTKQGPGKIDWCHWTWNPITGCGNGCWYCYAAKLAKRFHQVHGGPFHTPRFHVDRTTCKDLGQPRDGQRVFVCSMGDIFSTGVERHWVEHVQRCVKWRPQVQFLFCTKRPQGYEQFSPWPKNAWLGVSLDTYRTQVQRATALNLAPSYNMKWINAAPALDPPLDELWDYFKPDWVVAEPLHGSTDAEMVESEARVYDWHRWTLRHQVPVWIKGMKHWNVRCPIPKELPTLQKGKCSV